MLACVVVGPERADSTSRTENDGRWEGKEKLEGPMTCQAAGLVLVGTYYLLDPFLLHRVKQM